MSWKFIVPMHLKSSEIEEGIPPEKSFSGSLLNTTAYVFLKFDEEHILNSQCRHSGGSQPAGYCDHCGYNNISPYGSSYNYSIINCRYCGARPLGHPLKSAHQLMLIDNVGFIIGKTDIVCEIVSNSSNSNHKWQPLYKDHARNQKLSRDALRKHVPDGLPDATFYVVVTSMAEVPCDQAFAVRNIMEPSCQRPYGTSLNLEKIASKKFMLQGRAQVEIDGAHINSLTKKSEFFEKLIQKYSNERGKLKLDDVDAAAFEMLVEVNHYGKDMYMNTDMDRTVAQCCRDLLVVANQLLCHEVAEICAQCIIQTTTKDTVFADILLLANHYNGERKLEVISSLGEKIRDLKPDNKAEQLQVICETFPQVAVSLIDKLT